MFSQQMIRIIVMAKYDEIKLQGSNNMYRTQLWALATTKALFQVWEQDNISQGECMQLYLGLTKEIEDNTMVHVDMEFLFECLTWYLTSEHIIWRYLWRRFSGDFRSLFEDFLRFTKSCPKPDKRSEHFQKFPKNVNFSEGNRRFPRKKRRCFDHVATHL